jgi:hypothetical protein
MSKEIFPLESKPISIGSCLGLIESGAFFTKVSNVPILDLTLGI